MTQAVLDTLLTEYAAMRAELVRFLTARLGNAATAEDIYQELFLRLRAAQVTDHIREPRSFIYKAAYNLANEHVRARRRRSIRDAAWVDSTTQKIGMDTVAHESAADDILDAKQRLEAVMAILDELPSKCREVFILSRVQGLSHREVADMLEISTKTVEKHITTALKHLLKNYTVPGGEIH